jgi:tripartite ATP-independent transporter DctP family solute receptor
MFADPANRFCRRDMLRWTLRGAVAATAGASLIRSRPAQAATESGIRGQQGKKITLKFGSSQPTHTDNAHTVFFDTFVSELMSKTNGDIGAIFYGDSQLGPEDKYSNQINSGALDMMMTVSDWTPIVPEIGVLTMGFLFDSLGQTGQVMDGRAGQLLQDIFKQKTQAEILGWCYNFGGRSVLTRKPITTPAEFHGLKLRVLPSPTYVQTFRLMGADPVPMSFNEVYTSLQTGVIDGLEHDPPTILQFKFYEMAKNYTMTLHIFDPSSPIVGNATLARLSPAEQQALRQAATNGVKNQRTKATAIAQQALDTLKQNGVKMIEIDRAALTEEVKPLWKSFTDQHPDTKPVLEAILAETGKTL